MPLVLCGTNGISTDGVNWALRPDSSGRVFMPLQPCISRRITTGNFVSDGLIPWDTQITGLGITYNTGNRRFTVPVAGRYRISVSGFKLNTAASVRIILGVNTDSPTSTTNFGMSYSNVNDRYMAISFDVIVSLAANDYFTFRLSEGTLYSQPNDQFNYMAAHFIG